MYSSKLCGDTIKPIDSIFRKGTIYNNENIIFNDKSCSRHSNITINNKSGYMDFIGTHKQCISDDMLKLTDSCKVTYI